MRVHGGHSHSTHHTCYELFFVKVYTLRCVIAAISRVQCGGFSAPQQAPHPLWPTQRSIFLSSIPWHLLFRLLLWWLIFVLLHCDSRPDSCPYTTVRFIPTVPTVPCGACSLLCHFLLVGIAAETWPFVGYGLLWAEMLRSSLSWSFIDRHSHCSWLLC